MKTYTHILVLISDKTDGTLLLTHATHLARELGMQITLGHISEDYRELNYISDSLMDDAVSKEVLAAKSLLSELAASVPDKVEALELVTMNCTEDLECCISRLGIDLVMAGHRNRFMGTLTSRSADYVNRLKTDVLIKHITD